MTETQMAKDTQSVDWTPTRAAGLARLAAFLPAAGREYARSRNVDRGPADRSNVSALSPWIRYRLITEDEVIHAVLARHDFPAAEKFIQEVFWRTYWKGWLEMRQGVWTRFCAESADLTATWKGHRRLGAAMRGETGIDAFDAWAHELMQTGWLHNHARMWFASIWIFTLGLPWQLGASFFQDHLLDADPASNTLSWRWVAGLHTRGKHYLARASNIRDNTLGRFDPAGMLNERAAPIPDDAASASPVPPGRGSRPASGRVALLLTGEDLHPESWQIGAEVQTCAALDLQTTGEALSPAAAFAKGAILDALMRSKDHFGIAGRVVSPQEIAEWARSSGASEIVTAYAPVGQVARCLDNAEVLLKAQGQRLVRLQRNWDTQAWPHATAGFFKMKAQIPNLIDAARIP